MPNLFERLREIQARCLELASVMQTENRDLNEAEQREMQALEREQRLLRLQLNAREGNVAAAPAPNALGNFLREHLTSGGEFHVREGEGEGSTGAAEGSATGPTANINSGDLANTGIIPVRQQEIMRPLTAGLIWDQLGIPVQYGLVGEIRWPYHTALEAKWGSEGVALDTGDVDFTALTVKPERLGIFTYPTNKAIRHSAGVVESAIRNELPVAIARLINDAVLSTTGKDAANNDLPVKGVFVDLPTAQVIEFTTDVPTRKQILKAKAAVVSKLGGQLVAPAFVMTENMKAELEDAKVDNGSGRFLIENDKMLGYKVLTSAAIGEGNIGFGDFSYAAAGFFNDVVIKVDPWTRIREGQTGFGVDTEFGFGVLRKEAFVLLTKKS